MTRYKKEFKKHGFKFSEDFARLPFYDGVVTLEDRTIKFNHDLFFVNSFYDELGIVVSIYDSRFYAVPIIEESFGISTIKAYTDGCDSFVIWDDMPQYRFFYKNFNLMCVLENTNERGF